MHIAIAQFNPTVGQLEANANSIIGLIRKARENACDLILFSELALCGYPPEDLLFVPGFLESVDAQLQKIIQASEGLTTVIGTVRHEGEGIRRSIFNSAAVISDQKLLGFYDKILLPTYDIFDEARFFKSGKKCPLWEIGGTNIGITICEDLWQHSSLLQTAWYSTDPIAELCNEGPELVLNLSSSPYSIKKTETRIQVAKRAALSLKCPLILCNQVGANDSLLFDGYSHVINNNGELVHLAKGFVEDFFIIDTNQMPPSIIYERHPLLDLYNALVMGVKDYFHKSGNRRACLGLSGGIDSALVACIAAEALGPENVLGVALPSRFSSEESLVDAEELAKTLGIGFKLVPIEGPFTAYLELLESAFQEKSFGITEENLQARIRGTILMAFSNKQGYLLLNTGNKSELAMGYCTLYGDMSGALSVIGDVLKTIVYELAHLLNQQREIIPWNTIQKAPTAELRPNQKDSDSLPEYALLDPILAAFLEEGLTPEAISQKHGYSLDFVNSVVKRVLQNEYKRRQAPTVLRVTEKALTPSAGRRVPIIQRWQ